MIKAVDNSILTLLLNPGAEARPDPATGEPAPFVHERLLGLLEEMSKHRHRMLIPSPALAESLCRSSEPRKILARLKEFSCIEIKPFDQMAAIEYAELVRVRRPQINKIKAATEVSWQYVKMDIQIVTIAKAHGAVELLSDDDSQSNFAALAGLDVKHTWDLPLTEKYRQGKLDLG